MARILLTKAAVLSLAALQIVASAAAAPTAPSPRTHAMETDPAAGHQAIHDAGYVPIGGIEQWIQIRGDDRRNPVLLWLHGGPGFSTIPSTPAYRQWEKSFTVVMWDQRGDGKTFERSGKSVAPTMTIDRMTQDGIEVAEYLRAHLHKNKVVLLGHSWGSILGVHMVKLRPDLFAAYVGTGQVVELERDAEGGLSAAD